MGSRPELVATADARPPPNNITPTTMTQHRSGVGGRLKVRRVASRRHPEVTRGETSRAADGAEHERIHRARRPRPIRPLPRRVRADASSGGHHFGKMHLA